MNRARLALAAGISTVLVFLSLPGVSVAKWGKDYRKQTFSIRLIWKTSGEEKLFTEDEGFPPRNVKEELERNDAPEEEKEWLLNALRIIAVMREKVLYTNEGEAIELPKDGRLKWRITISKNLKYFMLCPLRWHAEARQRTKDLGRLKPSDTGFDFFGAELVERAKRSWEEYQREEKESAFILMDWKGKELWRLFSMPGRSYISDDAKTIVATHDGWRFGGVSYYDFYDDKREKVRAWFPYGNDGTADLSADGRHLVVSGGMFTGGDSSTLARYNSRGKELWTRKVKGKHTRNVCVSNDGSLTSAPVRDRSYLLDRKGNVIGHLDIPRVAYQAFSTDAEYMLVLNSKGLHFATTRPLDILWSYRPDHDVHYLGAAAILSNKELMAGTVITSSPPHKLDLCIFGNGRILDTILTLEGKDASLLSSPNGRFLVVNSGTLCAVYDVR
ncbi:hypothetical protein E3J62_04130 [candidate division TA06 bacterium]|uniref:WD40 repeat domain-containing protein n=1 Tax=candidate division TA06 bacterium TaxID=2250710 RepID=A0A523UV90_UNCT6|nr:MAG: hypothetical protein E3J62_04130 [candidate division TA06 bacterium]